MDGLVVTARGLGIPTSPQVHPARVPSKVHQGLKPHRPEFCTHQVYGTKLLCVEHWPGARRGRTGSRLELNGAILNDSIIRLLAGELRRQPSGPALRSPPDLGRKSARRFARSYKPRFVMPGTRLGETVVRRSTCALASSTLSPARAARGRLTWSERLGPFPNVPTGGPFVA